MTIEKMITKLGTEQVVYGDNIEVVVRASEGMDDEHQYQPGKVMFDCDTNKVVIWV